MSKTVNGTTTEYYWSDGTLLAQKSGENTLVFLYDDKGTPFGFQYNEATYYYTYNAQGDVTGILDHAGNPVARYTYDEWGSPSPSPTLLAPMFPAILPISPTLIPCATAPIISTPNPASIISRAAITTPPPAALSMRTTSFPLTAI